MALPLYLAQTQAEFEAGYPQPAHFAWMACHFSPYGTGLCGLPPELPEGAMVILNDRIPPSGLDIPYIIDQLGALSCASFLMDFQREGLPELSALTRAITDAESRPVGVTPPYAPGVDCPVFLPPVPPDTPVEAHLSPWAGREVWLEVSADGLQYRVDPAGARAAPLLRLPSRGQREEALFCHYAIEVSDEQALFSLWRDRQDLEAMLEKAHGLGVTRAVGLWQELGEIM